jgi:excisionase family DNA binding protein
MTVHEVAEYLRLTDSTMYNYLKTGRLPSFKLGRYLRIRRADVEQFIAQQMQQSEPPQPPPE